MKRILLIANKVWEVHPLLDALLNPRFQPNPKKPYLPDKLYAPWRFTYDQPIHPRAVYLLDNTRVEVWCIADHMDPAKKASSSEEKARIMPAFFDYEPTAPTLVIAFGTGSDAPPSQTESGAPPQNRNGCVFAGTKIFMHDGHPATDPNPRSAWRSPEFDRLLDSSAPDDIFGLMDDNFRHDAEPKMLAVSVNPSTPRLHSHVDYVGVSTVNITEFSEYASKDLETIAALQAASVTDPIGSVETTQGVIRVQSDAPFLFVSGIPNRFGKFGEDMGPKCIPQNYAAGFNAGIVVAHLLPALDAYYR